MADQSLGDFFAQKNKKKKIKGSNLNNASTADAEQGKKKQADKKDAEEEGWGDEEQVVVATLKVEAAGKLVREEDVNEEDNAGGRAWGRAPGKKNANNDINERKFPTLSASMQKMGMSSNIDIDDGSNAKINIQTSKNAFEAIEDSEEDEDHKEKRPTHIKPALVTKKKGEFEKAAVQREVDKYVTPATKKASATAADAEDDDDADDREEKENAAAAATATQKKKAAKARAAAAAETSAPDKQDVAEDVKIQPDLVAAKNKYQGRRRLPLSELPDSEMQEKKPEKKQQQQQSGKKKKMCVMETTEKKMAYADWD